MLSKRLRRRLRQIDNGPRPAPEAARPSVPPAPLRMGTPELSRLRRAERLQSEASGPPEQPELPPPGGPLDELVPGTSVAGKQGACWLVEQRVAEALPHGEAILTAFEAIIGAQETSDPLGAQLAGLRPREFMLLDTETGGLSSAPVFLVGLIVWPGERVEEARVLQMLARDYAEERAVLAEAARLLGGCRVLMTYNGRAFDLPMLRERMIYHGLGRCPEPPTHLDLLPEVRARFRGRWPDCRLQTVERRLCGRSRWGDINGADIPDAWHEFVHTGDAGRIAQIVEHNRLDLITMLEALPHLRRSGER
jgi:uncharacterized protein YprB with RNaseH-like and TPR domain